LEGKNDTGIKMSNDCESLVRRWFHGVWNDRRDEIIEELLTDESVCLADDGPMRGPAEFRQRMHTPFLSAFPDLVVEIEASISRGDDVVVRWTAAGTHTGDGLGFPPTRERVSFRGITWARVRDGKITEGWQSSNIPEVVRRLASASA
jgi:steroid delta-isomerase-like uncharacterized protein